MIAWKDDFLVGVDIIDEQHKKLFEIAWRSYKLLKDEFITDKYNKIVEILVELKDYTVFHFKTEEEYMMSIRYKKFLSHKVEHDEFLEKVNKIDFDVIEEDQDAYLKGIIEFVVEWIVEHIVQKDKLIVAN